MRSFYIIANSEKDENLKLSHEIADYLKSRGMCCTVREKEEEGAESYERLKEAEVEGILVLGGDGTLLRAARELAGLKIPFLGINLGHLGYLAEIEEQNVQTALDRLIADDYTVEERMMLSGSVWVNGKELGHCIHAHRIYRLQSVRRRADRVAGSVDPGSDPDLFSYIEFQKHCFFGGRMYPYPDRGRPAWRRGRVLRDF